MKHKPRREMSQFRYFLSGGERRVRTKPRQAP